MESVQNIACKRNITRSNSNNANTIEEHQHSNWKLRPPVSATVVLKCRYLLHSRLTLAAVLRPPQRNVFKIARDCGPSGCKPKATRTDKCQADLWRRNGISEPRTSAVPPFVSPPTPPPSNGDDGRDKTMLIICVHSIIRINGVCGGC